MVNVKPPAPGGRLAIEVAYVGSAGTPITTYAGIVPDAGMVDVKPSASGERIDVAVTRG